jgi:hypothetical protein
VAARAAPMIMFRMNYTLVRGQASCQRRKHGSFGASAPNPNFVVRLPEGLQAQIHGRWGRWPRGYAGVPVGGLEGVELLPAGPSAPPPSTAGAPAPAARTGKHGGARPTLLTSSGRTHGSMCHCCRAAVERHAPRSFCRGELGQHWAKPA